MAIKNLNNTERSVVESCNNRYGITYYQQERYKQYTLDELGHVKNSLDTPIKLRHKMEQLLEEVKLIRDFQTAVPRDKSYRNDDIDQEFDQTIDGIECAIQCIQNYQEELIAGEKIANTFDSRFYARR